MTFHFSVRHLNQELKYLKVTVEERLIKLEDLKSNGNSLTSPTLDPSHGQTPNPDTITDALLCLLTA